MIYQMYARGAAQTSHMMLLARLAGGPAADPLFCYRQALWTEILRLIGE